MERALLVAERGRGRATPNPHVGAVVVRGGVVVGQGVHVRAGGPHAEVVALDAAGDRACGATLYCTLEPCSHSGRTGPCTERIVHAGIRRVVVATRDPNPLVSGRGLAFLRNHKIDVIEDVGREDAERLHAPFLTWIAKGRPLVIIKTAKTSDGFVGTPGGRLQITGPVADRFFHRQRAEIDAIGVGAETVLADDPLLTARGAYRYRPLTRVVFDWRGRIPPTARVFSTLDAGPVIMFMTDEAAAVGAHAGALAARGVTIERLPGRDLAGALERLGRREILSLLVEGGPTLHRALAEAGLVDRVQVVVAPHRLGSGVRAFTMSGGPARTRRLGQDFLVEFDVHGPGGDDRSD